MEEGSAVSGEDPGMEVARKAGAAQQSQTPKSTPAPTKSKDLSSTFSSARGAAGMQEEEQIDEISKGLAIKAYKKSQDDLDYPVDYHWEGQRSDRLRKHLERKQGKNEKPGRGEGESRSRGNDGSPGRSEYSTPTKSGKYNKTTQKSWAKQTGSKIERERNRPKPHLPEETIEEAVSRKHFQQVADLIKGHESQEKRNELASHHAGIFAKQNPRFDHGRFHKASGSTAHEAPKKMEEAKYSYAAARRGENIGKKGPGTGFKNLAKKAAKEYGSEESGKRVAGAILAKIRAKHMEEQVGSFSYAPTAKPAAKAPIVPKSALAPGQSLRDYMNAKQGLTRRDAPSTTPKPAASTSAPKPAASTGSMQSTPGVGATAAKPASGLTTKNTPAFNSAQNASEPDQNKELGKPAEKSQSNFLQSQGIGVKPAEKPDTMPKIDTGPKPDSNPDQGHIKLTQTQPKDITQKNSPSYKSAQDSLAESVQVGANRYRIV